MSRGRTHGSPSHRAVRGPVAVLLVGGALLGVSCAPPRAPSGEEPPPHVVVYLVDTLRADRLGLYGYDRPTSPRLDALASDAVVFERAYAPSSWTKASTASLLSGLEPVAHGAVSRSHRVAPGISLAAEYLGDLGYRTRAVVTNPHVAARFGFAQGFEVFLDLTEDGMPIRYLRSDRVHREVEELLPLRGEPPVFLYVHTIDPHAPNNPPAPYDKLFTAAPRPSFRVEHLPQLGAAELAAIQALYDAEIRFNDEQFGRLVDELKRRRIYDDTLLIFVSDHGEEHMDHGRGGHGKQLFEEVVRVPLVVKFPHGWQADARVGSVSSLLDVLPTILAVAGGEVPPRLPGVDLRGLSQPEASVARTLFFDLDLEQQGGERHVARGVLDGHGKYLEEILPRRREMLFDLQRDPGETANLVAASPDRALALSRAIDAHRARHRSGLHLALVDGLDSEVGSPSAVVNLRLSTTGTFAEVIEVGFEEGDRAVVVEGGRGLVVTVRLDRPLRESGDVSPRSRDVDRLVVAVEPADAEVVIGSGPPPPAGGLRVVLGPGETATLPLALSVGMPGLALDPYEAPRWTRDPFRLADPALFVSAVPPAPPAPAELPPLLRQQLEALGYL